jgi:hypothetical protein
MIAELDQRSLGSVPTHLSHCIPATKSFFFRMQNVAAAIMIHDQLKFDFSLIKASTIAGVTATLVLLLLVFFVCAEDQTDPNQLENARAQLLKQEAAQAFYRLKNALEKDGFYSGRIALNVWRSTAIEAGTFDLTQYDEFKRQLYQKSIQDSLRCFEESLAQNSFYDANICLQIWRMHSKEIGAFDQQDYEAFKDQLEKARAKKASEAKESKAVEKNKPNS